MSQFFIVFMLVTWFLICIIGFFVALYEIYHIEKKKKKGIQINYFYELIKSLFIICVIIMLIRGLIPINVDVRLAFPNKCNLEIIKLTEFNSMILRYLLGCIVEYIPFGILGGLVLKLKKTKVYLIVFYGYLFSLFIQVSHMLWVKGRIFNINDLILNTLGTIVGYGLSLIIIKCNKKRFE